MGASAILSHGEDWLAILSRPTAAEFAGAFCDAPVLQASVLSESLLGVSALRAFFDATRSMYDTFAFTAEHRVGPQTWLDWQGVYDGHPISGVTLLVADSRRLIANVRIYCAPLGALTSFAAELRQRLDTAQQGDIP